MAEEGAESAQPVPGRSVAVQTAAAPIDVFISYSSQDGAIAAAVVAALEGEGISCWIAPRNVTPGAFYGDEIVHAIDAAKAIVLLLSKNAAVSPHVLREVERATSKRHPVLALRVDQAPLPAGLEYLLNTSQWLDASDGDIARPLPKLVAALRHAIEKSADRYAATAETKVVQTGSSASSPSGSDRSRYNIAISVGALLAVAIGGFAVYSSWHSAHQASALATANAPVTNPAARARICGPLAALLGPPISSKEACARWVSGYA
jgi:TIR domain